MAERILRLKEPVPKTGFWGSIIGIYKHATLRNAEKIEKAFPELFVEDQQLPGQLDFELERADQGWWDGHKKPKKYDRVKTKFGIATILEYLEPGKITVLIDDNLTATFDVCEFFSNIAICPFAPIEEDD